MTYDSDSGKSRDRFPQTKENLHGVQTPADIREGDRVAAKLVKDDQTIACQVWRMSPFGVELVTHGSDSHKRGDRMIVELTIEGKTTRFDGLVVDTNEPFVGTGEVLIGIRFVISESEAASQRSGERRKKTRWICSEDFYPTCVTPTPGRINDYTYFRIHDISSVGMRMRCSLRNKHLLPEMKLELFTQFPGTENAHIDVIIKRIRIEDEAGKDVLTLGVEFDNLGRSAKQSIGQYLMQFGVNVTPSEIKDAGFSITSVALGTEFYFLKTQADYESILELRRLVHIKDGNIKTCVSAEDMGDFNDSRSRIIVGKINGVIVATARLRYNESGAPLEHEAHLEWPEEFPRRDQIVEISRAATHPEYRQGDLFIALWRYMATYALQKQRPFVLIGSTRPLLGFYEKCGFRTTGHSHGEKIWTIQQHLMLCNLHETVMGKNTNPLYWNQMYEPIVDRAIKAGIVNPNEMDNIRMSAYRKLRWIAKLRFRKAKKK